MKPISSSALMDLAIDLSWEKDGISHSEHYFADQLNSWRDLFPGTPLKYFIKECKEPSLRLEFGAGELVPAYDQKKIHFLTWSGLKNIDPLHRPVNGRFYPQGILSEVLNVFKGNRIPFRCIESNSKGMRIDLNHPMANRPIILNLTVQKEHIKSDERGGSCTDWMELALSGPGMQARCAGKAVDFFSSNAFVRKDANPDTVFYETDRFVHHIDTQARQNLSEIYKAHLHPGEKILDLMAGWESHLPDHIGLDSVHGLGLNENELRQNRSLASYTLQDLNVDHHLDFERHAFDTVICSLSIEYLIDPISLFAEVARILKPGGLFMVTFSNRWFPEKSISIWEELHDFERLGLVTEYFIESGRYESISTLSMRGYPRPCGDRYFPQLKLSDPVYAVMGKRCV